MSLTKSITNSIGGALTSLREKVGAACWAMITRPRAERMRETNRALEYLRGRDNGVTDGVHYAWNRILETDPRAYVMVSHNNALMSTARIHYGDRAYTPEIFDGEINNAAVAQGIVMTYEDIFRTHPIRSRLIDRSLYQEALAFLESSDSSEGAKNND